MNKREYTRYDKDLQIKYTLTEKTPDNPAAGKILNISLGGVYMLSDSIIEKETSVTLTFIVKNNEGISTLTTAGSVLRSGKISDEPEIVAKYNTLSLDGTCFAVVKFAVPFIELSFMLH